MKFSVDKDEFSTLMSIASELDDETPVTMEENFLKVAMMDRTHTAMFIAQVPIGDVEDYEPTKAILNTELVAKKLRSAKKGTVKCEFKDNAFIMRQRTTIAKMEINQEHRVFIFVGEGLDEEGAAIPRTVLEDSTAFIKMPNAKALKDILSNIETDQFTIEATKKQFIIKSGSQGDGFDSEFVIEIPVIIKGDEQPLSTYNAELVKSVVKQFPSESNLSIKFETDRPLMISSMEDESSMDFLIAPNIEV